MENENDTNLLNKNKEGQTEENKENNINIQISVEQNEQDIIKNEIKDENQIEEKEGDKNAIDKANILKNVPLYIYSEKMLEINTARIPIYFFKGNLIEDKLAHNFTDIEIYRDTLRALWPCIYVPNFPLRRDASDENEKILSEEKKMKILNHFFKQIGEAKHLVESKVTRIFITKPKDYLNKINGIKKANYSEIGERYLNTFNDLIQDKMVLQKKEKFIREFAGKLEQIYNEYVLIGASILKEMYNLKREQNTVNFLANMFIDFEQAMPNKKKRLDKLKDVVSPICSVSNILYNIIILLYYYRKMLLNRILIFMYII